MRADEKVEGLEVDRSGSGVESDDHRLQHKKHANE